MTMSEEHKEKMRLGRERAAAARAAAGAPSPWRAQTAPPPPPGPNDERKRLAAADRASQAARVEANRAADLASQAVEAAKAAAASADKINRRIPNPAPVKMIVGAPSPVRGVPRKFGPEVQRTYFDHLARGKGRADAAALVGVSRQTIKNYRDKDPAFVEAELEAETMACELIEDALFEAALQGNVEAIKLWLFNRSSDRWKPAQKLQLEVSGQVDHMHDSAARTEHIATLEATLLARLALNSGVVDVDAEEPEAEGPGL